MAQDLHFYKLKVFAEDFAKESSFEEVNKLLLKATKALELESDDKKKEQYFEEIETSINISGNEIQDLIPKETVADTGFFLGNKEVLDKIRQIIFEQGQKISDGKEDERYKLYKELSLLEDLCNKNLLILNTF
ncbi:MAG: hypothetical protein VKK42_10855 [Lyngbya sp.]|nr:hypothetical protein [Lyngbya sp.]